MLNKLMLHGRLTKEPESSSTTSGVLVTKFSLAVDRRFKKQGEERKADFINCVSFNHTAEFVQKYFRKGQEILVSGSIQTRSYEKDGQTVWVTEAIVDEADFCGPKMNNEEPVNVAPEDACDVLTELKNMNKGFMPVDNNDECPW